MLLTAGLAAGCGNGDGTATDRASSTTTPTGTAPPETIGLIGQSGGGGGVDEHATVLDDDAAVAAFSRQFRTDAVRHRIEAAIRKAHLSSGRTVAGAVVSIGCDVPPGVDVQGTGDALTITPKEVASPLQECLVPVTTVALVAVDTGAA